MADNKENMRQAMKELLSLVGISGSDREKEEKPAREQVAAAPAAQEAQPAPAAKQTAPQKQAAAPKAAPAQPASQPQKTAQTPKAAPQAAPKTAAQRPAPQPEPARHSEHIQQEVAATVQRVVSESQRPKQEEPRGGIFSGFMRRREEPEAATTGFDPAWTAAQTVEPQEENHSYAGRSGGTVIAAGTSIFGDIRAEGEVEFQGKLKGNLEAAGNVIVTGKVLGDVIGDAVELIGCAIQGNVIAASMLQVDAATVIVGDVTAQSLVTDGKIKGNLTVARSATFQQNAVLAGNVTAALVSMSEGAKIQGAVRITQDNETSALFGEGLEI